MMVRVSCNIEKGLRLYEQEPSQEGMKRIGDYIQRWRRWAKSGVIWRDEGDETVDPNIHRPLSSFDDSKK